LFKFKCLLFTEEQPDKSRVLIHERPIQGWTRKKKLTLIKVDLKVFKEVQQVNFKTFILSAKR